MYYICYVDTDGSQRWELISGEDAMNIRVDELCKKLDVDPDDIVVFSEDNAML